MQEFLFGALFLLFVGLAWYIRTPSFRGAMGEARVNSALRRALDEAQYRIFQDVTLQTGTETTQIDHIVISRFGVFVIETKNMKGWIFGQSGQARWTQQLFRHRSSFQNPLRQNHGHIRTLEGSLGIEPHRMHGVVAFVGGAVPKTLMPANVVWGTAALAEFILSKSDVLFDEDEVSRLAARLLEQRLEPGRRTRALHIASVRERISARHDGSARCPKCSSAMVARANSRTGERFLGCSNFPKCRGARPLP